MSKLAGKVAVVTGASKGIGASIAEHLAAEGASVVVNYASSKAGADAVVKRIQEKGGKAVAVGADVSKPEQIKSLFAETKKAYGKVDVLVNNAGIYDFQPLDSITPEHFHKQFDLNVLGLLLTTQEAVKLIGPSGGSIINISSIVGPMPVGQAVRIQCDESGCGRYYGVAFAGAWSQKNQSQFIEPRHGGNRRFALGGLCRKRLPQVIGVPDAPRPHCATGGHRPSRRVLCV